MIIVEVNLGDELWQEENKLVVKNLKSLIKKIVPKTSLKSLVEKGADIEISVLLTNDAQIRDLNKKYRNQDKVTDVLSFPLLDTSLIKNGELSKIGLETNLVALGDIILARETIKKDAIQRSKSFIDHLTHLVIHGLLHLIGYDHEKNAKDAKIMEYLEVKLLKELDISNPYII